MPEIYEIELDDGRIVELESYGEPTESEIFAALDAHRTDQRASIREELGFTPEGAIKPYLEGGTGAQIGIGGQQILPSIGKMGWGALEGVQDLASKAFPFRQVTEPLRRSLMGEGDPVKDFLGRRRQSKSEDVQALETIGQATEGPSLARHVTATGGSLAPSVAVAPLGFGAMVASAGLQSYGAAFAEAKERGLNDNQAQLDGLVKGAITSIVTGGFGKTGIEILSRPSVRQPITKAVARVLGNAGLEATEEVTDEMLQLVYDIAVRGEPLEGAAYRALVAGVAGGLFGGGAAAIQVISAARENMEAPRTPQDKLSQVGATRTAEAIAKPVQRATEPGEVALSRVTMEGGAFDPQGRPLPQDTPTPETAAPSAAPPAEAPPKAVYPLRTSESGMVDALGRPVDAQHNLIETPPPEVRGAEVQPEAVPPPIPQTEPQARVSERATPPPQIIEDRWNPDLNRETEVANLPKPLKLPRPRFASELMEMSRRLKTTIRWKALKPGVLGAFKRTTDRDVIEVGDVRNTRTASHEIGHAIEFALNQSGQFPARTVGTVKTDNNMRGELWQVSLFMRPLPEEYSKSHLSYRKGSRELFADYMSLYLHDPVMAREMAPVYSDAFETAIESHPEISGLIAEAHRGDVQPTGPVREGAAEQAVTPPERLERPKPEPVTPEPRARQETEDLAKESIRLLSSQRARAIQEARQWESKLTPEQLQDVSAYREGIGNVRIPGDTIEQVRARMTPEMLEIVKESRFAQELGRQEINKILRDVGDSEYLKYVDDYVAHFYANRAKSRKSLVGRWIKNSPNAKKRTLPTLKEAVDIGLVPITQNAATLHKMWADINWRVAVNRSFVANLRNIKTGTGDPVIMPLAKAPSNWVSFDHPLIQQVYAREGDSGQVMLWRGGAAVHPDAAPAVRQMLYQPFGEAWIGGAEKFNAYAKKSALSMSFFHHFALMESASATVGRIWNPFRGFFVIGEKHPATGKRVGIRRTHTLGLDILSDADLVEFSTKVGLTAVPTTDMPIHKIQRDLMSLEAITSKVPGLNRVTRGMRKFNEEWDKALWDRLHLGLKLFSFHDLYGTEIAKARKWNERQGSPIPDEQLQKFTGERIAEFINDAFGGQEWQAKFWMHPEARRLWHLAQLAPDWTYSNWNVFIKTFAEPLGLKDGGLPQSATEAERAGRALRQKIGFRQHRNYWARMIPAIALAHAAIQYAIWSMFSDDEKGDQPWIWNNEKGQKLHIDVTPLWRKLPWNDSEDKERRYVGLAKQAREVLGWLSDPLQTARRKASPIVHVALEQIANDQGGNFQTPWADKSFWESLPERGVSVVEKFKPFSFQENNFAFSVPMRKGMTPWKARTAIESALDLYANPSLIRSISKEGPTGAVAFTQTPEFAKKLDSLVLDVLDAAKLNGHDPKLIMTRALGQARSRYYRDFFKAMENNDERGMEKSAQALVRLHSRIGNLMNSARSRGIELTDEDRDLMRRFIRDGERTIRNADTN